MSFARWLATGAVAGTVVAAGEIATYRAKRREIALLRERCRATGTLALTFDDGPSTELTPSVLALLAEYEAPATFFAVAGRLAAAPKVLDQVRAAGHDIGCHTKSHQHAWKVPPWVAVRDIDAGYGELARWIGSDAQFRPPFGKVTMLTRRSVRRRGAPLAWWTIDSGDTHAELPDPQDVVAQVAHDGGGVVLLHDHGDRPIDRRAYVLEVTRRLLQSAPQHGLTPRRLSDL